MNLLNETIKVLQREGLTLDDALWFGCRSFEIEKEDFIKLADKDYDSGYGAQQVASDLIIVGDSWWLERGEYDGSEWWEFRRKPVQPKFQKLVTTLITKNVGWESLAEMNEV